MIAPAPFQVLVLRVMSAVPPGVKVTTMLSVGPAPTIGAKTAHMPIATKIAKICFLIVFAPIFFLTLHDSRLLGFPVVLVKSLVFNISP
jgi:hypothetical protein